MRRKETLHISEVLRTFVRKYGLESKLDECSAVAALGDVIGEAMMQYVNDVRVREGVMVVCLSSSVVRSELVMNKSSLLERLNAVTGHDTIKDIVFR
ncbi:MAG: DUF721 domain-containing protein [Bacteroidetes bacterium]|uniref:DUF721 domain-containing protein n=1 Tax=Candidatus Caccoplasma merdipullorum TaxID=2840718 RepID=A0A9D9E4R3_9BACT|nr:DUF721 domain-containing protein [Candidatus Caccoplasma merdipullorum]